MANRFSVQPLFEKTKLIKASQCLGYALLFTALMGSSTCHQNNNRPERKRFTLTTMPVAINGCMVVDPIVTDNTHDVHWKSGDGVDYTITFGQTYDMNNSTPTNITPVPPYNPLPVPKDGSIATLPTATIPTNCSIIGTSVGTKFAGCYLKYSIAYTGSTVCNDPGVHVIPTGSLDTSPQ